MSGLTRQRRADIQRRAVLTQVQRAVEVVVVQRPASEPNVGLPRINIEFSIVPYVSRISVPPGFVPSCRRPPLTALLMLTVPSTGGE